MSAAGAAGVRTGDGPRFVVTVGTDHHPFDRLIGWINDWLEQHPERTQSFMVQWGSASVEPVCPGPRFLDVGQLNDLLDSADVMICHGGPGSIADAWARGQVPIAVPRLRRLGEVVDDHQVDFCRKLAGRGRVRLAEDPAALAGLLDEAIRDPARFRLHAPAADVDAVVAQFDALVAELMSRPRTRSPRLHRPRPVRHGPVPSPDNQPDVGAGRRTSRPAEIGQPEMASKEQG